MRITVVMAGVLLVLAATPSLAQQPAAKSDKPQAAPRSAAASPPRGDGPANALNSFVMKEITQCRTLPAYERRACCEKVLHPNACAD